MVINNTSKMAAGDRYLGFSIFEIWLNPIQTGGGGGEGGV